MDDNLDINSDGCEIFEKLIDQISAAEEELATLTEQLINQGVADKENGISLEAKILQEETKLLKKTTPEGFDEDDQIQYFLAVGHLEEQKKELVQIKEMSEHNIANNAKELDRYDQFIKDQSALVKSLEDELASSEAMEQEGDDTEQTKTAKRELESEIRLTRQAAKNLKGFLKVFIDKTAGLDPEYGGPEEGASIGFLLQVLYTSFLKTGGHREYVHIEALHFDVQDKDLQQLISAGIIQVHPQDTKKIRMVDFTMRS